MGLVAFHLLYDRSRRSARQKNLLYGVAHIWYTELVTDSNERIQQKYLEAIGLILPVPIERFQQELIFVTQVVSNNINLYKGLWNLQQNHAANFTYNTKVFMI